MKRTAIITAVLMVSAALTTACGNSELNDEKLSKPEPPVIVTQPTTEATTEPKTEPTTENKDKSLEERVVNKLSAVTWDYDDTEIKTKIVGNDDLGYIEVPEDWFLDEDFSLLTEDVLTYENEPYFTESGNYLMDSLIMDKCEASSLNKRVETLLYEAEDDQQVTEVSYSYPEIDGVDAVIVQFKYEEINKLRYTLFIRNDDSTICFVTCYETSNPNIADLIYTFTRTAPEGFSTDTSTTTTSSDSEEGISTSTTTTSAEAIG